MTADQCLTKEFLDFLFFLYWVIDAAKIAEFWFFSVSFTSEKEQSTPLQAALLPFTKTGLYLPASSKNYCIDSYQY